MQNTIITFGCRLNTYESEVIKESSAKAGLENSFIFNTCAVTKEAERQARQAIRKTRKNNPDAKIIVTGCAAQTNPKSFADMAEVDHVIGNEEKLSPQGYINAINNSEKILVNDIMSITETASHMVSSFEGKTRAFIQIQNGCNHRCTFCIIPYGRGNSRSVPLPQIIEQVQLLLKSGYKEITLTGVDITDYGKDLPASPTLGMITKRLLNLVPELTRLRLSSLDVAEIDVDLMDLICHEKRIMPHIHISLQSGNNLILKRMKRRHNREQVLDFCQKVRTARPDVAFGADIIAGFPTESEEMFLDSYNLIAEANISHMHAFPYSEREGTPAARIPNQVEKKIRKERNMRLIEAGNKEMHKFASQFIGKTLQVLVEQESFAKTDHFLSVKLTKPADINSIINVQITDIDDNFNLIANQI
jgi:threonylcarbamoyladenosine tRNA methylthiotransferase MtaB